MICLVCFYWRDLFGWEVEPPKHKCWLTDHDAVAA